MEGASQKVIVAVGEKIRLLRKENNLSQAQLAFEAGIERTQVARIERGEINTGIYSLYIIAKVLNVHVSVLFEDIEMDLEE